MVTAYLLQCSTPPSSIRYVTKLTRRITHCCARVHLDTHLNQHTIKSQDFLKLTIIHILFDASTANNFVVLFSLFLFDFYIKEQAQEEIFFLILKVQ